MFAQIGDRLLSKTYQRPVEAARIAIGLTLASLVLLTRFAEWLPPAIKRIAPSGRVHHCLSDRNE